MDVTATQATLLVGLLALVGVFGKAIIDFLLSAGTRQQAIREAELVEKLRALGLTEDAEAVEKILHRRIILWSSRLVVFLTFVTTVLLGVGMVLLALLALRSWQAFEVAFAQNREPAVSDLTGNHQIVWLLILTLVTVVVSGFLSLVVGKLRRP